jgi:hypothetical protein
MIDNPNDQRRIAADVLYSAVLQAQRDAGDFALSDAFDMLAEGSGRNVFRHVAKVIRGTKLGRSAIDDREALQRIAKFPPARRSAAASIVAKDLAGAQATEAMVEAIAQRLRRKLRQK